VTAATHARRPRNPERPVAGFDDPLLLVVAPASASGLLVVARRTDPWTLDRQLLDQIAEHERVLGRPADPGKTWPQR
jgi:hypothetical protein